MLSPDQPAATCDQSSKLNGAGVKTEDKTEGAARGKERTITICVTLLFAMLFFGCSLFYCLIFQMLRL